MRLIHLAEQGVELAKRVLDWRQLAKLRSTYTEALPTYIHPENAAGAHQLCDGIDLNGAFVIE